jgi:methionyl-tRNA formyltransferase
LRDIYLDRVIGVAAAAAGPAARRAPQPSQAMNEVVTPAFCGADPLRSSTHLLSTPKTRVAVFGSFHGGYHVLTELLEGPLADQVRVVGVATDDPQQPFTHADVRLWKYEHTPAEEQLVPLLARAHGLPLYTGRVKAPEFEQVFVQEWKPDFCLMATFGQLIPKRIFQVPRLGFYNFHHSDQAWPSYPGPDPIRDMLRDGKTHVVINLYEVSEALDGGRFVARSHRVPLPPDANAVKVHRLTWPQMGGFIREQVERALQRASLN